MTLYANKVINGKTEPVPLELNDNNELKVSTSSTGGGGDASAANQTLQITQETNLNTVIGVKADSAATTDTRTFSLISLFKRALQGITTIISNTTGLATAANQSTANSSLSSIATNTANPTVSSRTVTVGASFTRPADTTAYTALDAVSNSTSAGTVLTFTNLARQASGSGYITKARILTNQSTNTARFRLHLFAQTPDAATVLNDNAAYTQLYANRDKAIGTITFLLWLLRQVPQIVLEV